MNRVVFVTAIYTTLYGTIYGGRPSRAGHYKLSLLNLVESLDADFVCYTSQGEVEELRRLFYIENDFSPTKIKIIPYDFSEYELHNEVDAKKDRNHMSKSDRCYDLQYLKTRWLSEQKWGYDYYFWIDAGLSYSDLIPDKYLRTGPVGICRYFSFNIFEGDFLTNLCKKSDEGLFFIAKNNTVGSKYESLPDIYYENYGNDLHLIGGLFGGKMRDIRWFDSEFVRLLRSLLKNEPALFFEEFLYTKIYYDNSERFSLNIFDNWQHSPDGAYWLEDNFHLNQKSFYKTLEELR